MWMNKSSGGDRSKTKNAFLKVKNDDRSKLVSDSLGGNKCSDSRNLTLDFVRGIAISLVVFGHNIQFGSGSDFYQMESYFNNFFFKFIYSFHMPLFALLSGYLFYGTMRKPAKQVLKKRTTSLLLPIFSWMTLECLGRASIMIIKHKFVITDFVIFYVNQFFGGLWFLWAIF